MQYILVNLHYIYIFTMFKKRENKIKDIKDFSDHAFSGIRYFGYGLSIGVSKNGLRDLWCSFPYPLIHSEKKYIYDNFYAIALIKNCIMFAILSFKFE